MVPLRQEPILLSADGRLAEITVILASIEADARDDINDYRQLYLALRDCLDTLGLLAGTGVFPRHIGGTTYGTQ